MQRVAFGRFREPPPMTQRESPTFAVVKFVPSTTATQAVVPSLIPDVMMPRSVLWKASNNLRRSAPVPATCVCRFDAA